MSKQWLDGFKSERLTFELIDKNNFKNTIDIYKDFKKWRKKTYKLPSPRLKKIVNKKCLPPGGKKDSLKFYLVREVEKKNVIGLLALYDNWPDNETLFIAMLYLSMEVQNKGYGQELMNTLCNYAESDYKKLMIRVHQVDRYKPIFFLKNEFRVNQVLPKNDRILTKNL